MELFDENTFCSSILLYKPGLLLKASNVQENLRFMKAKTYWNVLDVGDSCINKLHNMNL